MGGDFWRLFSFSECGRENIKLIFFKSSYTGSGQYCTLTATAPSLSSAVALSVVPPPSDLIAGSPVTALISEPPADEETRGVLISSAALP